jgi:hypothetical protein
MALKKLNNVRFLPQVHKLMEVKWKKIEKNFICVL